MVWENYDVARNIWGPIYPADRGRLIDVNGKPYSVEQSDSPRGISSLRNAVCIKRKSFRRGCLFWSVEGFESKKLRIFL